ncbi:MAG: bifunctional serine/threonine-protein kinase/formylglycine-generating enzyme family protein, partial [Planctomycetaceae bacterium]
CRSCAEILDTLEDESAHFISLLRNAASSGFPDVLGERQFEAAVRNLSSQSFLAAASRPATSDSTQTGRGNSDPDFRVHHSDSPAAANSGVCTDIDLPVTLGQYDLLEKIGQGGMGVVYRARHRKLNRVVAVKILSPLLTNDVGTVERFEGEMRAIGTLDHPNIVRALDASEVDGKHFLVMEYVDGTNLTDLVRSKGPLPVSEALQLIRQACRGLQHIYEAGMVHRDIKPRNLMLSSSGELRILDLGLALLTGFSDQHTESSSAAGHSGNDAKRHLTTAGKVMGTIDYIAPEQADNTHAVDIRADIYSLGCTLYFLLTGKAPFADRPALSIDDRMRQMKNEGPTDIRQHCPDVVPEVVSLLNRMMELAPENRFLSPRDVLAALDAISTAQDGILTPGEPPPSEKQTIGPDRGHAGIIATVAIISGLALVLYRGSEPAPELMTANPSSSEVGSERHLESKQPTEVLNNSTVEESASSLADSTEIEITSDLVTRITEIRKQADDLIHTALDTGKFGSVLRAMQRSSDPTLRTTLIHRLAEFEVPPEQIVYQLMQPCDAGTEAALWLCLGTYTPDSLSSEVWQQVVDIASIRYSTAPDSGVHSAIWWLVNHWKQQNISGEFEEAAVSLEASIRHLREQLQLKPIPGDGGWFETLFNETMIVVPAGTTYIIGSPSNEPGRVPDNTDHPEIRRKVTLPVTIAVSATELTQMQFSEAIAASIPPPQKIRTAQARSAMSWHEAAWYCNRRSELEGLPIEQHCYVQTAPGPFPWGQYELKENYQHLSGYRLLSEEEWEYCCRAGTTTSRHFGNDDTFASHYMVVAEHGHSEPITVGTLMPNDLGFFDMHGNVAEWVNDQGAGTTRFSRRARGGSIHSGIGRIRSALRLAIDADHSHPTMGLRLCRSIIEPASPTVSEVSVDVLIPPHVSALIS